MSAWVPVAGVFAGSGNEIQLMASGNNEGVPTTTSLSVRSEQRTYESNFWMVPSPRWFKSADGGDFVIAKTSERNYTATEAGYKAFFTDIGFPEGYEQWLRVENLTSALPWPFASSAAAGTSSLPPQTIRHLYGTSVDTPESMVWSTSNPSKAKDVRSCLTRDGVCLGRITMILTYIHFVRYSV